MFTWKQLPYSSGLSEKTKQKNKRKEKDLGKGNKDEFSTVSIRK